MKKTFVLLLVIFTSSVLSQNTIFAIVNKTPITLNSVQVILEDINSKEERKKIINNYIDNILQIQKALELNLVPSKKDLEDVIYDIATSNNLSLKEFIAFEDFPSIKKEILEKLSILNLQRFITKDLKVSEGQVLEACSINNLILDQKQIKIAQIIVSEIDSQINDLNNNNLLIKTFLNKLASHIKKGASFEAFAKLHSQHPSYQNGGITDWLPVKGPTLEMIDLLNNKEVSEIYMTDFGLAIAIKVDERFISSKLKECKEKLIYEHAEMYYSVWLTNLREEANIEIYYDKLL
ncbi:peptidylprolyl isomerase [Candidatus Pseudothioglobus singularis]|nr:peptidylprolyl isomerase [Candidatus Pseudothioglobus singularis]